MQHQINIKQSHLIASVTCARAKCSSITQRDLCKGLSYMGTPLKEPCDKHPSEHEAKGILHLKFIKFKRIANTNKFFNNISILYFSGPME